MKKILIAALIMTLGYASIAQQAADPAFVKLMETHINLLDTATTSASHQQLCTAFEKIANTYPGQWQPNYYAGFCYAVLAFHTTDKSQLDALADKADAFLDKADALQPANSEISTLRAMITSTRILVDPAGRWQNLSAESADWIHKAQQQDPANPRPWYIEAKTKLYTPAILGGGPEAALPALEEAGIRFKSFRPANSIAPNWGKAETQKLLTQLKK